ncbi:MAG: DUF308 domain-containing protein [Lachnospiraceae bacterium]|nr:DUF308 domain-containing protein [Lachnospiraceae bacterium]
MTKTKRVIHIIQAFFMMLLALILFTIPEEGIVFVILIIGFTLSISGIGTLIYYFQMARSMVGGKIMLYRGIIVLDLGLFILSLTGQQAIYLILCTSAIQAVTGIFSILRAYETKKVGSKRWILSFIYGLLLISLMIIVVFSWIFQSEPIFAVYVYAFGLVLSAIEKAVKACKKTAIAYIP